jgi:[acyl-carrier-protein] S-malonyltransferase
MFNGPDEELSLTSNTQPAIMAVSIATLRCLQQESGKDIEQMCDIMAGHSLGQYTALCASESISLSDTAKLLRIRGSAMQNSCPVGLGSMAAIIFKDTSDVHDILKLSSEYGICEIANDNSDTQIVISGSKNAIDYAITLCKERSIRGIELKVSAPFHSSLLLPACNIMEEALSNIQLMPPKVKIIDNTTLEILSNPGRIKSLLLDQICGTVRWRETSDIIATRCTTIYEIGPGKILGNMIKRKYPDRDVVFFNDTVN